MQKYLELLQTIKEKGAYKPAAREGMPGTQSLFGYQFRHDLSKGFPLLTTKEVSFKHIVVELLWFLKGDTNIKYLVVNDVNIWNEDAYNYYLKRCVESDVKSTLSLAAFIAYIKEADNMHELSEDSQNHQGVMKYIPFNYTLGDCGHQYGKVWRSGFHEGFNESEPDENGSITCTPTYVDQISNLIKGLRESPQGRRHIVTAVDPAHDQDLALYWCHSMMQFNCRPLTLKEREEIFFAEGNSYSHPHYDDDTIDNIEGVRMGDDYEKFMSNLMDEPENSVPKYYLDCQMYQRSADVFLGVPYNIASYALLTHILSEMCNMIPGEFIHTFGDVHIYDNHKDQVEEQLSRAPSELPTLNMTTLLDGKDYPNKRTNIYQTWSLDEVLSKLNVLQFQLENYNPQEKIKGKLSTGLK